MTFPQEHGLFLGAVLAEDADIRAVRTLLGFVFHIPFTLT